MPKNSLDSNFECIVGVDQTGAKTSKGKAKKLPVSIFYKKGKVWKLSTPLHLDSFKWSEIESLLDQEGLKPQKNRTLVVADCVLGLPEQIVKDQDPLTLLLRTMRAASLNKGVGLSAGEQFFIRQFPESQKMSSIELTRKSERGLKCLSVFKNKPFQKNVQTGTYRIWSDLGEEQSYKDFNIWPYQNEPGRAYLCEGYPSYAKKNVDIKKVEEIKKTKDLSPDHQDAAALCLLGKVCADFLKQAESEKEGKILILEKDVKV